MTDVTRIRIPPQSGIALELCAGQTLRIVDPIGEQVADVTAFAAADRREWLSSGRTLDYAATLALTRGHVLYSNRSTPFFTIVSDTVGKHDFLLAPCSAEMFTLLHGQEGPHPSCFANLADSLARFGIDADAIPVAFNAFMNVEYAADGRLRVLPPLSRAGDHIDLRGEVDLIIGVTACSAEETNNHAFKPIDIEILD